MNRLAKEKAAYLRHAAEQKIDWYPWSDEAFERARREGKPVFLSSGGVWCHWCHVMAKECFGEEEIVRLLNENFINIKIDRDERPDIDRIYQQAVAAMGHSGGWPLSVFLTPERKPFFGGTYFPPEDSLGRPGFKRVLRGIIEFYRSKGDEVADYSKRLTDFLKPHPIVSGPIKESLIADAVETVLSEFDPQNGGFGTSPKFPMAGSMELLINRYFLTAKSGDNPLYPCLPDRQAPLLRGNTPSLTLPPEGGGQGRGGGEDIAGGPESPSRSMRYAIEKTLTSMAKGGFHDHLGGGFHRYSVDEAWIVPHFEKMADDNAWLLRNYVDAYRLLGDERFREVAEGTINFIRDVLSDPEGGFYASQDADVTPEDEGGYFTWTEEDFRRVLDEEEYAVLSLHLFHERGSMHHDRSKRVLFAAVEAEEIARKVEMKEAAVREIIGRGKEKLLRERSERVSPYVDTTIYTSINGMLIPAYLKAYRALGNDYLKDFAIRSLKRIIETRIIGNELYHSEGVKALLEDHVTIIDAFIAAYEVTGNGAYLNRADGLMERCIAKFFDKDNGGFFDAEDEVVGVRLKGVEDIPHPSANSLAIIDLLRLYFMTGRDDYYSCAETSLKAFSLRAHDLGIHSAYYYCALDAYFNMLSLRLDTSSLSELAKTALSTFNPYVCIVYGEDKGYATPCRKGSCYESIYSADALADFLKKHP